jgi:proteasome activator subunit 4
VENYAHPSNFGRWTQVLALFLQGLIKYMRKRVGSKQHARLPDAVTDKFAACVMRLVDKGMYSKNSVMRHVASSAAGQLAYIRPAHVLPFVMGRFMEAVEHSTATHQLNAALSVLTSCLRPMLLAPQEAFEGAMCPPPAEYLAATLDATLPGIDANDPSKTLGTIRLYAALVSNLSCLADPGQSGACEAFPFMWSEWTDALLQRFFAFFQNVDASKVTQADGSDKHRGGAGGDGGASYLMGATSMYSPLMRLIFARMHPSMRLRAVKKIAQFCLTSTHSGLTGEVGQMVMAAVTQAPEEAVPHLTRPLLDALAAEVEDVCRLVADNKDGILSADKIVSPTKEAKLKWLTGLLGAGMHYGGPRVVALSADIRAVVRKLFELCDAAKSLRLGEMGAHVVGLYKSNPLDP